MTVSCHNNLPWPILFWGSYISQNAPGLPEGTLHPSKEFHLGYCRLSLEYFFWALFRERLWFGIRLWGFLNPSNWTSTCFGVQSAFQYQTLKLGFCYRFLLSQLGMSLHPRENHITNYEREIRARVVHNLKYVLTALNNCDQV